MLASKVAVITGAARGIGGATARLFAREGASVMLNDMDASLAEQAAAQLRHAGATAHAFGGSVMDDDFAERLIERTVAEIGAPDVIVNNAGFLWDGMLHKMSDEQWQAVLTCHLTAPFRISKAAASVMRGLAKTEIDSTGAARDRCIVNVTSTSGLHGNIGQANYAAAKAGIVGLTKTLAKEWGPLGIRANTVAFGMIDTRMTNAFDESSTLTICGESIPQGLPEQVAKAWSKSDNIGAVVPLARKGSAHEAAQGILFLASPLASYVTGHTLEVTGGMGI